MPRMEGVDQQTPEWLIARVGVVTASRVSDVMSRLKKASKNGAAGEPSQKCLDYMEEIMYETLTGKSWEHFVSPYMDFGQENEDLARAAYEHATDSEVLAGGFWLHDGIQRFGASPDGLVGEDGLVEFKVPLHNHLSIIRTQTIPPEYEWQMLAELACTGRKWCDFATYHPFFPKETKLWIKRFPRDDARIEEMERAVCEFLLKMAEEIKKLGELCAVTP